MLLLRPPILALFICSFYIWSDDEVDATTVSENTDHIIQNVMTNYKKAVHPETNDDGAVEIRISVIPLHIDVDEENKILHSHVWLVMSWVDKRVKWDKSQYGNVSNVHLAPDSIWKPDIRAFNSILHEDYEHTDAIIYASGQIFWIPPVTFHTSCDFDFTYWPWDVQKCVMVIGSWTKTGNELDVLNSNSLNVSNVDLVNYTPTIWDITSARSHRNRKTYSGMDVSWPDVTVALIMKRLSYVDRKLAVLPLIVVCCLTLATFWTFPLSRSRITLGTTNLLILILMLIYFRSRLPMSGTTLPLIVAFAGSIAVLVTIQLLSSLAIANLVSRKDEPPSYLIAPFEGIVGRILCLSDVPLLGQIPSTRSYTIDMEARRITSAKSESDTAVTSAEPNAMATVRQTEFSGWNLFAQAVDRIHFLIYLFIMLICMATYIGSAAVQKEA